MALQKRQGAQGARLLGTFSSQLEALVDNYASRHTFQLSAELGDAEQVREDIF